MKLLAYLLNIVIMLAFAVLMIGDFPTYPEIIPVICVGFVVPLVNIRALCFFAGSNENWISLLFKRKALEERKKIEKIEDGLKGD